MVNWIDVMYAREVRKDALARAAKARLIRQIQGRKPAARSRVRLWLAHLRDRLYTWGQHLKPRYADAQVTLDPPKCYKLKGNSGCCMC